MNRRNVFLASVLLAVVFVATTAVAAVTTPALNFTVNPGGTITIPIKLTTTAGENVAAISGQLNFNYDLFSAPTITLSGGAAGFTAVGNEISRGKYRFVIYKNPTGFLQTNTQDIAAFIHFSVNNVFALTGQTDILYLNGPIDPLNSQKQGETSASNGLGQSLANVSFGSIHVKFNQSAVENWLLYE